MAVEIECAPEDVRRFLGLPDVTELNAAAIETLRVRINEAASSIDTETLMKTWMPAALQGMEQWQKLWAKFASETEQKGKRHGKSAE